MKQAGTDYGSAQWSPQDAVGTIPHRTPARMLQLVQIDRETCLVPWGGPPSLQLTGDLPSSARTLRVRPPWWATRARVLAVVAGAGTIVIGDGSGYDVVIPFTGDENALTVADTFVVRGGAAGVPSPTDDADRLVNLSAPIGGDDNDLTFHKTGTCAVQSLCLWWHRGADTFS